MTKSLILAAVLSVFLAGCATIKEYLPNAGRAAEVAVNMAVLGDTVSSFEGQYIVLREKIAGQSDKFSETDWADLQTINLKFVEAKGYLDALRDSSGDAETIILNLRQIGGLIEPIQEAGLIAQVVLDRNIDNLTPDSQITYQRTSRLFTEANGQINDILADPDAARRVERLKRLAAAGSVMLKAAKILL